MATSQGANNFTLTVEFAGICLYVIDDRNTAKREVAVLMPTCVPTGDHGRGRHEDLTEGVRHVPYLLADLANFDQQVTTPGLLGDGPKFQVVRRLNREEIVFGLEESERITLRPDPLPLPNLTVYNDRIQLKGDPLAAIRRTDRPELNVRTILKGGRLEATTTAGSDVGRKRPDWNGKPADWAGSIKWTRDNIPGNSLAINIQNWDKAENDQPPPLTLRSVPRGDIKIIELKIAILCETNPLEWREFGASGREDDDDFKWLFRLFEAKDGSGPLKAFGGPGNRFPFPQLNPRNPRLTGNTGCTGGQFGLP